MKLTAVLVTYNRSHLLGSTLEGVLSQTYADFEVVVSDDGSTDDTEGVVRAFETKDPRVRYRRNRLNLGMPGNLNAGIRATDSEFVGILHDGDRLAPTLFEKWVGALETCPGAGFAFNAYRSIDDAGRPLRVYREDLSPCVAGDAVVALMLGRWRFGSPVRGTVIARRAALEELGLFDERFGFWSDVDMWFRLAERYDVGYVREPLIALPKGTELGTQGVVPGSRQQRRVLERTFWEARARRARGRPTALAWAGIRHASHVAVARSITGALSLRRWLLRRDPKGSRG